MGSALSDAPQAPPTSRTEGEFWKRGPAHSCLTPVPDDRLRAAGQLIQFGLRPRLFPGHDREYRDLLARYRMELEFQEVVDAVAEGLGLTVASATQLGFFLAAQPGSVFAYSLSTFRRDRGGAGGVEDRLLHGLGMVA